MILFPFVLFFFPFLKLNVLSVSFCRLASLLLVLKHTSCCQCLAVCFFCLVFADVGFPLLEFNQLSISCL